MYKGEKCCPGCNRSGRENPRYYAESLCNTCSDLLNLGRATMKQNELEAEWITTTIYPWFIWDGQIRETQKMWNCFIKLCNSLSNSTKHVTEYKTLGSHNSEFIRVTITRAQFECLCSFYEQIIDSIPKIYSRAKKEGADLLMSLNNGEITMQKINESLK